MRRILICSGVLGGGWAGEPAQFGGPVMVTPDLEVAPPAPERAP